MASAVPSVFPTCSLPYSGEVSVARYTQVELNGADILPPGESFAATSEMNCLRQCSLRAGCVGYFYRSDEGRCWPKGSDWTASSFLFTSPAAIATGSVTGLLGTCAAASAKGATSAAANNVCCNAQMSTDKAASYGLTPRSDCSCGYFMSQYGNAYYPKAIVADFSSVSSIADLSALGLNVATGRIGGIKKDDKITSCRSDPANVRFTNQGTVQLVVPGKRTENGRGCYRRSNAERRIHDERPLVDDDSHQSFPGTCQALFTYIDEANFPKAGDEQDIEIRPQLLDKGIQLTNWNPESYHVQSVGTWEPFPREPITVFNNYTIFWPGTDISPRQTSYYFNGQLLKTFDKYVSVNPSSARLSNWSNGQLSFTQGPPAADSVLEVAGIAYYYSTAQVPGLPSRCTMEQACRV